MKIHLSVGDEVPQPDTLAPAVGDVKVGQNQPVDGRPIFPRAVE